jgi:hypothetical protein
MLPQYGFLSGGVTDQGAEVPDIIRAPTGGFKTLIRRPQIGLVDAVSKRVLSFNVLERAARR